MLLLSSLFTVVFTAAIMHQHRLRHLNPVKLTTLSAFFFIIVVLSFLGVYFVLRDGLESK